ncbi:unnamed protein product [Musa textilis]
MQLLAGLRQLLIWEAWQTGLLCPLQIRSDCLLLKWLTFLSEA